MRVRRILLFILLLGGWVQSASACPEAHAVPTAAWKATGIAVSAVYDDFAVVGGEHRCEHPSTIQDTPSMVPRSGKSLRALYEVGPGAFLSPPNPESVASTARNRAAGFLARPSGRPPYLLVSRLRQ